MPKDGAALLPGSALFIDVPNTLGFGGGKDPFHWRPLIERLVDEIVNTRLTTATAYAFTSTEARVAQGWLIRMFTVLNANGLAFECRDAKDVDSWIMNDIWKSVVAYERHLVSRQLYDLPFKMRHVLVSGDGGYLRTYRDIRALYGDELDLELIVYSWRGGLNHELERVASEVRYLDDIPGLRNPIRAVS